MGSRIQRGRSRRTRRGSGESHLVNGERKEVFEDCEREKQENQERIR